MSGVIPTTRNADKIIPKCCVNNCMYSHKTCSEIALFKFPVDNERYMSWLKNIEREDLWNNNRSHFRVCELHFKDLDIISSIQSTTKILKKTAVPTLCLPMYIKTEPDECSVLQHGSHNICSFKYGSPNMAFASNYNIATQTEHDFSKNSTHTQTTVNLLQTLPCVKKLKEELKTIRAECQQLKHRLNAPEKEIFLRQCDQFLPPQLSELVKLQANKKLNAHGNRYSSAIISCCKKLYKANPKQYNILKELLLLPSEKTLQRQEKNHDKVVDTANDNLEADTKKNTEYIHGLQIEMDDGEPLTDMQAEKVVENEVNHGVEVKTERRETLTVMEVEKVV